MVYFIHMNMCSICVLGQNLHFLCFTSFVMRTVLTTRSLQSYYPAKYSPGTGLAACRGISY